MGITSSPLKRKFGLPARPQPGSERRRLPEKIGITRRERTLHHANPDKQQMTIGRFGRGQEQERVSQLQYPGAAFI